MKAVRAENNTPDEGALVIFDVFKGHMGEAAQTLLEENGLFRVIVPNNCTHLFQPLDLSVYKLLKDKLRRGFSEWYTQSPAEQSQPHTKPQSPAGRSQPQSPAEQSQPHTKPQSPAGRSQPQSPAEQSQPHIKPHSPAGWSQPQSPAEQSQPHIKLHSPAGWSQPQSPAEQSQPHIKSHSPAGWSQPQSQP